MLPHGCADSTDAVSAGVRHAAVSRRVGPQLARVDVWDLLQQFPRQQALAHFVTREAVPVYADAVQWALLAASSVRSGLLGRVAAHTFVRHLDKASWAAHAAGLGRVGTLPIGALVALPAIPANGASRAHDARDAHAVGLLAGWTGFALPVETRHARQAVHACRIALRRGRLAIRAVGAHFRRNFVARAEPERPHWARVAARAILVRLFPLGANVAKCTATAIVADIEQFA